MALKKDTEKDTPKIKRAAPTKPGKPRNLESPAQLYEIFQMYKTHCKANPYIVEDWVGKDAIRVERKKERPLTIEGFKVFVADSVDIEFTDIKHYIENTDNRYAEYRGIITRIRDEIRTDQIGGGMASIYNATITARINNLVEKTATELSGTLNVPKLPDIANRE